MVSTDTHNALDVMSISRGRTLWMACVAHALHDGYTDLIYLLLPIWQAEFGLGYGVLALLRGLAAATMAGLQVPAGRVAERLGGRATLALGTTLAAIGFGRAGSSEGLRELGVALIAVGCGLSTQHPIASAAVSRAFGQRGGRGGGPWHAMLWIMSALGGSVAVGIAIFLPQSQFVPLASRMAIIRRDARAAASFSS